MDREAPGRRAILVDLDGVVRIWPATHRPAPEDRRETVEHALGAIAFGPELLPLAITGRIDDATWRREVAVRLARDWPGEAAGAVAAWSAMRPVVDDRVRDLVLGWRQRVPVVLVTNATTRLAADLRDLGIDALFDAVCNSAEVGHAKPDPRAYRAALDMAGAAPAGAIMVDDTLANVDAARALGLAGHHYEGDPDTLARVVSGWLGGDPPLSRPR